jgi:hypothetical protein
MLLASGCVVPHYVQHDGALVPHSVPIQSTGQPMEQALGFELGATNLADLAAPESGVHQTVTTDPVRYGPAIGLWLRLVGGKRLSPAL